MARLFTFIQSYLATRQPYDPSSTEEDRGAAMVELALVLPVLVLLLVPAWQHWDRRRPRSSRPSTTPPDQRRWWR